MRTFSTHTIFLTKISCFVLFSFLSLTSVAQSGSWLAKSSLPSDGRGALIAFAIGDKGYVGLGLNFSVVGGSLEDLWEYDPATDSWTQKADYGGGKRGGASAFVIEEKGYVMTGTNEDAEKQNDLWEYDPVTNTWLQKADIPTEGRNYATAFAIGSKGYLATGEGSAIGPLNDLWEYDPVTDNWTQKADVPGGGRSTAASFAIDGIGYLGTGYGAGDLKDFYAYDPVTDSWTQKANVGDSERSSGEAFVINGYGYICTGQNTAVLSHDLLEYDPAGDTWTLRAEIPGTGRMDAGGFAVGSRGYIAGGFDNSFNQTETLYEFTPDSTGATFANEAFNNEALHIFPALVGDDGFVTILSNLNVKEAVIEIYTFDGLKISTDQFINSISGVNEMSVQLPVKDFSPGIYLVVLKNNEGMIASGKIIVQ